MDTSSTSAEPVPDSTLSGTQLYLLTAASAVTVANAYYIHPIIARVAEGFGVSAAAIGLVPALNQIALAMGILLILPLGDMIDSRRITTYCVRVQFMAIATMALTSHFGIFTLASTVLGFATITPYLIPAYVSRRVGAGRLGQVTAIQTTGVIAGILLARAGAGTLAEHLGWRSVYYVASVLMLAVTILLPRIMDRQSESTAPSERGDYRSLLLSLGPLIRTHPDILLSGTIQGCSFGIFLCIWLGLGLHLTSPQMGYGVDVVGYLAMLAAVAMITTPRLGRWADRYGPLRARVVFALVQMAGVALLEWFDTELWLLMLSILIMNAAGPAIDVTGRMISLGKSSQIRTRLMTIYIVLMFIGGGLGSLLGTSAYQHGGWQASAHLALVLSVLVVSLSIRGLWARRPS